MLIHCPLCASRDIEEFTYWGDATIAYPPLDGTESQWYDAVYQRTNPPGEHEELWHHERGCRNFVKVKRNITTHEIFSCDLVSPFAGKEASK